MDVLQNFLILPLFSVIFFIIFLHKWRSTPQKNLPPSPKKLPIIGNLHQLGQYPHRSLYSLSKYYGPLLLLHFGRVPILVVSSADAAREIMKNQDLIFSNRPKLSIPDRLTYGSKDVAFSPYGNYWREVRSICVLQLLSNKRVQSYRSVREQETSIMVEKIRQMGSSSLVVNLSDMFVSISNDVICRVALGRKYGEDGKFKKFLGEFAELLGAFSVGDYIPCLGWIDWVSGLNGKVKKVAKLFDEFLEGVIEEHRQQRKRDVDLDFVDILLDFQRENEGSFLAADDDVIKAIILDMFAAGTDTTSSVLEWAMAELIKNPRTLKVLQDEVREVARGKEEITEDDLDKMRYLKAVIKESLRLHLPIPTLVLRQSTQDTKVLGYDVAAGTQVMINAWAIARAPSLWENPDEFYPARFLDTNIDFRGLNFEFIPFGAGRRGCPGISFAMAINELVLAKLVHKFNFQLPNGEREENLDMSEANGITIHKKLPLLVVATQQAY
ncbi:Cytochrome P450 CYP2 subfamily [Handroanthus impetiginosus]|uniref:Cytochrome P450 CYP2 subfamily n=1 Tax=Handroanthus impetiginosus TaxID=429701 RepID=A0A2G9HX19_9LAMI|nr:Cytochrome P450 CYP2 subfamily [Handroanthus impetiginosus]